MAYSHPQTATTSYTNTAASTPMRPSTPEQQPYSDNITPLPRSNPFGTPLTSRPASFRNSSALDLSSAVDLHHQGLSQRYFHSRRVRKGEVERPWMDKKDPREKWVTIIPLIGLFIGFALAGFLVWDGLRTVTNHVYCPVLDEDWSNGFNEAVWTKEAEVGGFGYASCCCSSSPG